jgi:hypothetical protein
MSAFVNTSYGTQIQIQIEGRDRSIAECGFRNAE